MVQIRKLLLNDIRNIITRPITSLYRLFDTADHYYFHTTCHSLVIRKCCPATTVLFIIVYAYRHYHPYDVWFCHRVSYHG